MQELRQRHRDLSFLERVVRATVGGKDQDALLGRIIHETTDATDTQVASLYLLDDDVLTLAATNGLSAGGIGQVKLALGKGVTGWVAQHRQPLAVLDVHGDRRFVWIPGIDEDRFTSMLSVPVASRARLIGVINVQTVEQHAFSDSEVDFLIALAALIAGIVEMSSSGAKVTVQLGRHRDALSRPLEAARALAQRLDGMDQDLALSIQRDLANLRDAADL